MQNPISTTYHIAVLADLHGNLAALQAILADLEPHQPLDALLVAGDFIAGPDQQQVLQCLQDLGAFMIQGNNEAAVVRMLAGTAPQHHYTAQQFALRRWACDHLTPAQRDLIASLPEHTVFQLPGAAPIHIAHGSPRSVNELVLPDGCLPYYRKYFEINPQARPAPTQLADLFEQVKEPVLVVGHSHLPWCVNSTGAATANGRFMMNPGAVNFPLNGWVGAQYALLHWDGQHWTPEFRAIRYDLEAFQRSNEISGFLDTGILARVFLEEVLQGKDISFDFFLLLQEQMDEAGLSHLPYCPDEIWERGSEEFKQRLF